MADLFFSRLMSRGFILGQFITQQDQRLLVSFCFSVVLFSLKLLGVFGSIEVARGVGVERRVRYGDVKYCCCYYLRGLTSFLYI